MAPATVHRVAARPSAHRRRPARARARPRGRAAHPGAARRRDRATEERAARDRADLARIRGTALGGLAGLTRGFVCRGANWRVPAHLRLVLAHTLGIGNSWLGPGPNSVLRHCWDTAGA